MQSYFFCRNICTKLQITQKIKALRSNMSTDGAISDLQRDNGVPEVDVDNASHTVSLCSTE